MNNKNINIKKAYLVKTPKIKTKSQQKIKNNVNQENNSENILIRKISKTPKNYNETKINQNQTQSNINRQSFANFKINKFYTSLRSINYLSKINTFDKVVMLQKLLKEFSSIKGRFEENINKLTKKMNKKCYEYFKNKIFIKEILDYCESNKPEEHKDYNLIENNEKYFDKNVYQLIYDFYFLIRNENYIMLQIIKFSYGNANNELSDFFVNFLYENVINSSFIQDELILMIYLLLDDLFFESFPKFLNINKINNNKLYTSLIKNNSFLFLAFQSLTKKIDVKNFLSSILSNIILKIESFRNPLSTDLKIANKFLDKRNKNVLHSFIQYVGGEKKVINKKRTKNLSNINQGFDSKGNNFLRRANKISLGSSDIFNKNDEEKKEENVKIVSINDILNSDITVNEFNPITNNINQENNVIIQSNKKEEVKESKINFNLNNEKYKQRKPEEKSEIDPFFENNSVTLGYLINKLNELKKVSNNDGINYAMIDYISHLIFLIESGIKIKSNIDNNIDYESDEEINIHKDKEIFSNSLIIEELISIRKIKNSESFKQLMSKIKRNYKIINKIISNIINNINDNLISSPFIIKYISKLLIILLDKKYKRVSGNKLTNLNIYIFKLNFFIGNIILPIIKNPEINGIITSEIISQITKDNLKMIHGIFNKIISLELFDKYKEPYMTIFNPLIIEIIPKLFEMMEKIDKNFIIPLWIQKLINDKNNITSNPRNINYDFFKQNKNENMQYQSICFSWKNLYMILLILLNNENKFMEIIKVNEHKKLFKKLLQLKDQFINNYITNEKLKKEEFFLLTRINYRDDFAKKMRLIIKNDLSLNLDSKTINNAYLKKCFSDILSFTKIIEKDDFISFSLNKSQTIYGLSLVRKANQIIYGKISNNNDILEKDCRKDINFKNIIFPKMLENVKFEIGYNADNSICKNILFSCNYLNMNINSIPRKYSINNFDLFFNELIRETEFNIEYIKNDAILQYYTKDKEIDKNIVVISEYSSQIRNLEKLKSIEYLFNNVKIPYELNIEKDSKGLIKSISNVIAKNYTYNKNNEDNILNYFKKQNQPINYFIEDFPDFHEYEDDCDNIFDLEEKLNVPEIINNYFAKLKNLIKQEKIIKRFDKKELVEIIYNMQNYIFTLLYDKLFPSEPTKNDLFFYNKCSRLNFIKPENIMDNKNLINENLINIAIEYLKDIDDELTPVDKIKKLGKVIEIIQNSIYFVSGKTELGVDDVIKPLIYTMIKTKPKNICSNYQYCELYLNSELAKTQYGIVLSQIGLVIEYIKNMKYNDLINVSVEQFGKDEKKD